MSTITPMRHSLRLAVLALTAALALAGCGNDDPEPAAGDATDPPASQSSPSSPTGGPTSDEPAEPTTSAEPTASETPEPPAGLVPVYFTGQTPRGVRLYREFQPTDATEPDMLALEAVQALVTGDALDPDYGTLLGGVTVRGVGSDGSGVTVSLAEDAVATADKSLSRREAVVAVQSLVYTVQGALGVRAPVKVVLADGSPVDLLGQPTGRGVRQKPPLGVLSLASISTPNEGDVVSGTMTMDGAASSFEATVPYFVTDASGEEVLRDFTTADGYLDKLYPFAADVDVSALEPGDYTLHVQTDDPSGGEGPGPYEDTRGFTVE